MYTALVLCLHLGADAVHLDECVGFNTDNTQVNIHLTKTATRLSRRGFGIVDTTLFSKKVTKLKTIKSNQVNLQVWEDLRPYVELTPRMQCASEVRLLGAGITTG